MYYREAFVKLNYTKRTGLSNRCNLLVTKDRIKCVVLSAKLSASVSQSITEGLDIPGELLILCLFWKAEETGI